MAYLQIVSIHQVVCVWYDRRVGWLGRSEIHCLFRYSFKQQKLSTIERKVLVS